jgi:hypothetical protein
MLRPMSRRALIIPSLLSAAFLFACGGSKKEARGPDKPVAAQAPKQQVQGGQQGATNNVRTADLDGDGRPEVWKYYKTASDPDHPGEQKMILVREDLDLNWDGKPDIWRYFNDKGQVEKEEWDTDFDGKVDEVRYFEDGVIVRAECDRNNDGKYDVVRFYKNGQLEHKEVDTDGDGKVDRWEYYNGKVLDRVGMDKDHDGTIDTWAKAPNSGPSS